MIVSYLFFIVDVNDVENFSSPLLNSMNKCPVCSYSTPFTGNLKRHLLLHSGHRRFKCGICGKLFTLKQHLKSHLTIHEGFRFTCEICRKSFSRQSYLRQHVLKH